MVLPPSKEMKMRGGSPGRRAVLLLLTSALISAGADRLRADDRVKEKVRAFLLRPERTAAADADRLTKLMIERFEVARREVTILYLMYTEVPPLLNESFQEAVRRQVDAEVEFAASREERLALLEGHVEFLKEVERVTTEWHNRSPARIRQVQVMRVRYNRLNAEIRLLREKPLPFETRGSPARPAR